MNNQDAGKLIDTINTYGEYPIKAGADSIAEWALALRDVPMQSALESVRKHYATNDTRITPRIVRSIHNAALAANRPRLVNEAHCGLADCVCTHDSGCFKGWTNDTAHTTTPCPYCRPELAEKVEKATVSPLAAKRNQTRGTHPAGRSRPVDGL